MVRFSGPLVPEALRLLDRETLIGLTVRDARERVEACGGIMQVVRNGIFSLDLVHTRVRVAIQDGRVVKVYDGLG